MKYFYYGQQYELVHEFSYGAKPMAVIKSFEDYPEFIVVERDKLVEWEKTYQYTEQQKIKDATEKLKANKQDIIDKLKKDAVDGLVIRLKLNSVFAKDGRISEIGQEIANQVSKLIEEKKIE